MASKQELALYKRFPAIFAERHLSPMESCMHRGLCVDAGWLGLVEALCECLQATADTYGEPQPVAMQVKEKLGSLRFRLRNPTPTQRAMTVLAEAVSRRICEVCGAAAEPRDFGLARCPAHPAVPHGAL